MSNPTMVILLGGYAENEVDAAISDAAEMLFDRWVGRFTNASMPPALGEVFRGAKEPDCYVWLASFNWLDAEALLAWVHGLPWRTPDSVHVVLHEQQEARLRFLHRTSEGWDLLYVSNPF
jgi:hypothetical protein